MTLGRAGAICRRQELRRLMPRYEFGALSEEERGAFEWHVLECDACFEELELGSLVAEVLRRRAAHFAASVRSQPTSEARAAEVRRRLPIGVLRPRLLVPLVALVLVGIGTRAWIERQRDTTRLATFPRQLLLTSSAMRAPGTDDAMRELMQAGAAHLDLGHYEEAARRFRAARERDPSLTEATYALGLTLALSGDTRAAIPHLQQAARQMRDGDLEQARWVLANAYLKTGMAAVARQELADLAAGQGEFAAPSRELLLRLEQVR